MAKTRKKVKVVGTKQYINTDGEIEDFQVIKTEDRDFNFHKIWFTHIIQSFDLIGNQKTKLAFWLIAEMDNENKICYTLRQMSEKSNISLETVRVTIKALIDGDFLIKQNQGVYRVHPDKIFKGTLNNRLNVLLQYNDLKIETLQQKEKNDEKTPAKHDLIIDDDNEKICPHCDEKLKLKKDKSEYYCPNFFSKDEQKKCKGHTEKNIYFGDKNPNSIIEQIKKTDLESCKKLLFGYDKKTLIEIAQQVKVSIKNNDSKERIVEKIHFDLVSFGENWNAMTRGVKD